MEYQICKGMSISVLDAEILQPDIDRALLALTGFEPSLMLGEVVWIRGELRYWLPREDYNEHDIEVLSADLNATAISPALDSAFSQSLLRITPMMISPVVFQNNRLMGEWHVENNPQPSRGDIQTNGHQLHQYQHQSLPLAISMVFLQAQGIGQNAWIYIGERASDEPELHYIMPTESTSERLGSAPCFFRAPALDKFAATGVPVEILAEEFEKARLKRIIATTNA